MVGINRSEEANTALSTTQEERENEKTHTESQNLWEENASVSGLQRVHLKGIRILSLNLWAGLWFPKWGSGNQSFSFSESYTGQ